MRAPAAVSIVFIVSCLLAGPQTVRATVLAPTDFPELVRGAGAIVHGRVLDVRAEWVEGGRMMTSTVTLDVIEYLKGDLGPSISFMVPGGELGRYRNIVLGAPVFSPGEEVIVFLNWRGSSRPYVLGLNMGVFRTVRDTATGRRMVRPSAAMAGQIRAPSTAPGHPTSRLLEWSQFSAQVNDVLREPALRRDDIPRRPAVRQPPGGER
jgi:hypothetical protein